MSQVVHSVNIMIAILLVAVELQFTTYSCMIHGIQMTEQSMETKIAVLEAKVDHMMVHTKELTLRVRANEKVVASVSLLGVIACTFIGAGYFAPKAEHIWVIHFLRVNG